MNPLVSILMPTRNAIGWLDGALKSINETANDMSRVEILLRMDDDDTERLKLTKPFFSIYGAKTVVGTRGSGYTDMGRFVGDLLNHATGDWVWLFDDDSWLEGCGWQEQLQDIKCDHLFGPAVQCETYKLGPSVYPFGGGCVGLIMPRLAVPVTHPPSPVDATWHGYIQGKGWPMRYLNGVAYCHDGRARG